MKLGSLVSPGLIRGRGRMLGLVVAATLLVVSFRATQVMAGDVSAQPADSLSINTPGNTLLPQSQAAEESWLDGLHISGYASQTFGMWQNPTALKQFTPSRNNLAVSRTLLQVDENYRLNENNNFFMREWFVYEPPYSWDSANIGAYNTASANTPFCTANCEHPASYGHFMNDWYNIYQVRDAWWENKTGPLTTFIGNQIVVWGQSLAFRVGDVINPVDTTWAFGFANLEQSRNAQWMIHPILNLPQFGPLNSNFIEMVLQPGFAPQWWECDYADGRYLDECTTGMKAGRAATGAPSAEHNPSARFDLGYSNQPYFGLNAPLTAGGFVPSPAAHEFWSCSQLAPGVRPGFNPVPAGLQRACALGLSKNTVPYGVNGDGNLVDIGQWRIPGMQPQNWNEGARFHTLIGATELTALYYNDNVNGGYPASLKWTPYTNLWTYSYPDIQDAGVTADRPLPIPASLAEFIPAVGRAEFVYSNHNSFDDMSPTDLTAQGWSDVVKWMVAIDLDQAYAPWLTSTGNLTANVEVYDSIVMDNQKTFAVTNALSENHVKNDVSVLFNLGTSWWWDDFAPTFTTIFQPKGRNIAMFPALVVNPPWTKKYFLKLQAIEVMGGDHEQGVGWFKGESLLTAQFQYNFNIL
jgi:hypothetical protein